MEDNEIIEQPEQEALDTEQKEIIKETIIQNGITAEELKEMLKEITAQPVAEVNENAAGDYLRDIVGYKKD